MSGKHRNNIKPAATLMVGEGVGLDTLANLDIETEFRKVEIFHSILSSHFHRTNLVGDEAIPTMMILTCINQWIKDAGDSTDIQIDGVSYAVIKHLVHPFIVMA